MYLRTLWYVYSHSTSVLLRTSLSRRKIRIPTPSLTGQMILPRHMLLESMGLVCLFTLRTKYQSLIFIDTLHLALNIAANDYEVDRIADAYAVAEPLGFQFFYSFDMSSAWSQSDMVSIVAAHAHSSSTFRYEDAVLVSTYSGESLGDSFWSTFKSTLQAQGIAIKFAPAFTSYRDPSQADSLISTFPSIDGFFNWWSWYASPLHA